jgi:hypothetical protein
MIRASFRGSPAKTGFSLLLLFFIAIAAMAPARAALEANPQVLYEKMKAAFDKAQGNGWDFRDQEIYLSTIFNAGRAYSLQRPNDPQYGNLATLTVQIGSSLHYDPLTNHDAAVWWVREASEWVIKNSTNQTLDADAQKLLARANAEDHPELLAEYADRDAAANVKQYPSNFDALLQRVEADWRGWLLTDDSKWRSLAFEHAAQANFPLAHLPTTYGPAFLHAVETAANGAGDYSPGERADAQQVMARMKDLVDPLIIASVHSVPHDMYLTTLAPADEYFGPMGYSILGIKNELKHINFMLNYKYGNREAGLTVQVADSIVDMHHVYPRDRDMPELLYSCIETLGRMSTPQTEATAKHLKGILTVEYQDSPQAQELLSAAASTE